MYKYMAAIIILAIATSLYSDEKESIQIYPNPAPLNSIIKVEMEIKEEPISRVEIRLYNILGQMKREIVFNSNWSGKKSFEVRLPETVGTYIMVVRDDLHDPVIKKILVIK